MEGLSGEFLLQAYAMIEMRRRKFLEYVMSKMRELEKNLDEKKREMIEGIIKDIISDMDWQLFLAEEELKEKKILFGDSLEKIDMKKLEDVFLQKFKERAPNLASLLGI